jgi:methionyl aminopeptidase
VVEIKTPDQIKRMRETCRIGREVLDAAARIIQPGITTDEIDRVVHDATIAAGGYPSPLNYHFFPKSCCTSVNEVICHGIPDARKLEDGDIVNVDVTVYYNGVHGDLNETFFVGNVDEESRKLVQVTYECLEKAISIVKPGMRFREIGEIVNRHASMSGLSVEFGVIGCGLMGGLQLQLMVNVALNLNTLFWLPRRESKFSQHGCLPPQMCTLG